MSNLGLYYHHKANGISNWTLGAIPPAELRVISEVGVGAIGMEISWKHFCHVVAVCNNAFRISSIDTLSEKITALPSSLQLSRYPCSDAVAADITADNPAGMRGSRAGSV